MSNMDRTGDAEYLPQILVTYLPGSLRHLLLVVLVY